MQSNPSTASRRRAPCSALRLLASWARCGCVFTGSTWPAVSVPARPQRQQTSRSRAMAQRASANHRRPERGSAMVVRGHARRRGGLRRAERCATAPGVLILSEGWSSPMKRLSPLLRVVSAVHAAGDDRALRVGLEPDRQAGQRAAVHSSSDSRARGASSTILLRLR